jgi:hypothetical protein
MGLLLEVLWNTEAIFVTPGEEGLGSDATQVRGLPPPVCRLQVVLWNPIPHPNRLSQRLNLVSVGLTWSNYVNWQSCIEGRCTSFFPRQSRPKGSVVRPPDAIRGSFKMLGLHASIATGGWTQSAKGASQRMRCAKTVTPIKIDANRKNAKRSTGPRTERGKSIAKFNAVTLGLFAKHVVIPICDGYKPEKEFQALLDGLHQEFQPVGLYEEWLVVKIAECMWRLRRATRCESGSVQEAATWNADRYDSDQVIEAFTREMCILDQAERQLRDSGTLSQKTYREVAPLVEEERRKSIQSEQDDEPIKAEIDHELFLTFITYRKEFVDSMCKGLANVEGKRSDARFDYNALLPECDMERVLRYEERMHRQIDWAVQRLLEAQERRKTVGSLPGHGGAATGQV